VIEGVVSRSNGLRNEKGIDDKSRTETDILRIAISKTFRDIYSKAQYCEQNKYIEGMQGTEGSG
jgi:hypothetical protein